MCPDLAILVMVGNRVTRSMERWEEEDCVEGGVQSVVLDPSWIDHRGAETNCCGEIVGYDLFSVGQAKKSVILTAIDCRVQSILWIISTAG